jgi:hypothetical protein
VLLEVARQLADGHPVDARATFVRLDSLQCPLQVVALTDLLHQPLSARRALGCGLRRARFGPFGRGSSGFTLCIPVKGQLELDLLPPCAHEFSDLLALPFNPLRGPFGPSAR